MMSEAPENVGLELGRPLYLPGYIGETGQQSFIVSLFGRALLRYVEGTPHFILYYYS
jgi:hypothetical protein